MLTVGDEGLDVAVDFEIQRKGVGTFKFNVYFQKSRIMSPEEEERKTSKKNY